MRKEDLQAQGLTEEQMCLLKMAKMLMQLKVKETS